MERGIESRFSEDELSASLESLVKRAGVDAPTALRGVAIETAPWIVLTESEHAVTIGTGTWGAQGPGKDGQVVNLEKEGARWAAVSWGDCPKLRPFVTHGDAWVELSAPDDLDRSSTQIALGVHEVSCSSGRDPRPFLRDPRIIEDDHSVTISWTVEEPTGANNCQGTMPVPQLVRLQEPLGDRVLLDGSYWPARPIDGPR
ncbi:hypothetical protein N802_11210 [Knoellia sinensis KCTC 19936]|uniref:Uncharacterized protein n=1 Tax=Knoellia sinensis KCTC 19936 TaxID=1385520 RepID=A0A0A0J4Q7_9MICO|nr:hypothetical protein [Knoellia sinensis]KGN32193.1 hypothetical protein N802_11210 [Knoellia sinensis KCTC 19936]